MATPPEKKKSDVKGQREADQVRQIAASHGGKITASQSGSHTVIVITCFGRDPESPETRAMLYAIEFAIRGRFDRGRSYQGMTQFTARSRVIDVMVRCIA